MKKLLPLLVGTVLMASGLVFSEYTVPYDPVTAAQIDIGRYSGTYGAFLKYDLYLDDILVVTHKARSAISVKINPGKHIFCYRTHRSELCKNLYNPIDEGGIVTNWETAPRVRITLEPNQRNCYRVGFAARGFTGFDQISCKLWDEEFGDRRKNTKINY